MNVNGKFTSGSTQVSKYNVICCVCHTFQTQQQEVAVVALEDLAELGGNPSMTLTALRCLIRLQLTDKNRADSSTSQYVPVNSQVIYADLILD